MLLQSEAKGEFFSDLHFSLFSFPFSSLSVGFTFCFSAYYTSNTTPFTIYFHLARGEEIKQKKEEQKSGARRSLKATTSESGSSGSINSPRYRPAIRRKGETSSLQ